MLRNIADAHISSLGYLWCRPKGRVGFLRRFGLKTGIDFTHSGLELSELARVYARIHRFTDNFDMR